MAVEGSDEGAEEALLTESPDVRQLRHLSSGRPILMGRRLVAAPPLAANVQAKILARHTRRRVGTDLILRATRDQEGGLRGALEGAGGLAGMKALYEENGAEITIDLRQVRASAQVVEATVGECNNGDRSFHQKDSVLLTAGVHRAVRAAVPTSSAANPLYEKNANDGGCEQTVDKNGAHHCRQLQAYPRDMREAAKQIDRGLDEAVARDCPEARVLVKHRFGNFNKSKHTDKDGKPIVRRSTVARDMVGGRPLEVLESTSRYLCQGAHSGKAALSIASTRLALKVEARRVLGESAQRDDGDVAAAVVAMLRKLATGEHESPEYRESLDTEKTAKLVAVADGLRGKSLADVKSGVKNFGNLYGGRGYNAEDGRKGGSANYSGEQKGREKSTNELKAEGGATLGTGANHVGGAPSDGAAATARRVTPGAPSPARAHGLCFGLGADGKGLAEKLKQLVAGENGFGKGPITTDGCNTPKFGEAGVTTSDRFSWQLDDHDNLILPVHNSQSQGGKHPRCQIGGVVPVTKVKGSWRLCPWAYRYVSTGRVVQRITHNERHNGALQKSRDKKRAQKK
eukprot:g7504.t1